MRMDRGYERASESRGFTACKASCWACDYEVYGFSSHMTFARSLDCVAVWRRAAMVQARTVVCRESTHDAYPACGHVQSPCALSSHGATVPIAVSEGSMSAEFN